MSRQLLACSASACGLLETGMNPNSEKGWWPTELAPHGADVLRPRLAHARGRVQALRGDAVAAPVDKRRVLRMHTRRQRHQQQLEGPDRAMPSTLRRIVPGLCCVWKHC